MKKKSWFMGIALIMFCMIATVAFANVDVSFNSSSVSVKNPAQGTLPKVELCVTVKDSNGRTTTETWTFINVTQQKQTQNARPGTTIIGAFATYCPMPVPDK